MALTFISAGTTPSLQATGTGTTSASPDIPAHNKGDLLLMCVGMKGDSTIWNGPTNWFGGGNYENSTGSAGSDTGPSWGNIYWTIGDGIITSATISNTEASFASCTMGQVLVFRGSGYGYELHSCWGEFATAGTAWSVTGGQGIDTAVGDHIVISSVIPTDASAGSRWSAHALTQTSVTFNTLTEVSEPSTTFGNQCGGCIVRTDVTAGPGTAAPVYSATASTSTNQVGTSVIVRIRDVAPPASTQVITRASTCRSYCW